MGIVKELKLSCNYIRHFKKFRHLFLLFSILLGIILTALIYLSKTNFFYIFLYLWFCFLTFLLIREVSEVNNNEVKTISKWKFLCFILRYFSISTGYIIIFGLLYKTCNFFSNGFLYPSSTIHLKTLDYLYISAMNFLSYDLNLQPSGYVKLFLFFQVFFSKIMILGFLFIIFNKLLDKIQSKDIYSQKLTRWLK